jgi:hypothetical protein
MFENFSYISHPQFFPLAVSASRVSPAREAPGVGLQQNKALNVKNQYTNN